MGSGTDASARDRVVGAFVAGFRAALAGDAAVFFDAAGVCLVVVRAEDIPGDNVVAQIEGYEECSTTPDCPGDLDGDLDVDLADLSILLSEFGMTGGGLTADIDGDGDVDLSDLAIILSNFATICT